MREQTPPTIPLAPIRLQDRHVLLEPLQPDHATALERAAADGELWDLWFTGVPAPGQASGYIEKALQGLAEGLMLPFAVREADSGEIVGTTRFYDFVPELPRIAIGYTWYARRWQKSHLNLACKQLLLQHAFESLGWSSTPTIATSIRSARSNASARIATACCARTSGAPTTPSATPSAIRSWPANGRT